MRKKIIALSTVFLLSVTGTVGCGGKNSGSETDASEEVSIREATVDMTEEEETSDSGCYLSFGDITKEEFIRSLERAKIPEDSLLIGTDTVYDENAVEQLNRMLKEAGYDFQAVFCRIPDQCCLDGAILEFAQYMEEQKSGMDILPVWNTDLGKLAEQGLLTDLTAELEEEQMLKDAYPEKFWELTAWEGKNYGPGSYYVSPCGWAVHRELMEKYGFDREDLARDITALEDVFKTVAQGEEDADFAVFLYSPRMFLEKIPFSYIDPTLPIGYWTEDTDDGAAVENLFDTERMKTLVDTMNRYYQEGYAEIEDDMVTQQSFFMQTDYNDYPVRRSDSLDTWTNASGMELLRIPYYQKTTKQLMYEICTIPSWSEKKETAWEFLAFVCENEKASNLLLYGTEGENYSVSGDTAKAGEELTETDIFNRSLGNLRAASVLSPYEDSEKKELLGEELNSLQTDPLSGFVFDEEPVQEEVEAVRSLYMELSYFREMFAFEATKTYKTWQEYYEAYNLQLKSAGIDHIVEEMNRQIQEYLDNENQD